MTTRVSKVSMKASGFIVEGSNGGLNATLFFGYPTLILLDDLTDTKASLALFNKNLGTSFGYAGPGIALGPGNDTDVDTFLYRSGSVALTTNATLAIADATGATHSMNRQTADARYLNKINALRGGGDLPTGAIEQTTPRKINVGNLAALTSGVAFVIQAPLLDGDVISSITWVTRTTAAAGLTNQWSALLDSGLVVRAVSTDKTSEAWAANTPKTFAMASPYTVTANDDFYFLLMLAGTTMPTLSGFPNASSSLIGITPKIVGTSTTGLTTPSTVGTTLAAITNYTGGFPYAYCS